MALARPIAKQVDGMLTPIPEGIVSRTVDSLGHSIVRAATLEDFPFEFRVMADEDVNAFAIAGGHVYVYRGLLTATDHMAELAGVLCHEIAHVVAGHSVDRLDRALRARLGLAIAARGPDDLSGSIYLANYSRASELEADSLAVGLMIRAGWEPEGLVSFLRKILARRDHAPSAVERPFMNHPLIEDRIRNLERLIELVPAKRRRRLARSGPEYDRMKEALENLPLPGAPRAAQSRP